MTHKPKISKTFDYGSQSGEIIAKKRKNRKKLRVHVKFDTPLACKWIDLDKNYFAPYQEYSVLNCIGYEKWRMVRTSLNSVQTSFFGFAYMFRN